MTVLRSCLVLIVWLGAIQAVRNINEVSRRYISTHSNRPDTVLSSTIYHESRRDRSVDPLVERWYHTVIQPRCLLGERTYGTARLSSSVDASHSARPSYLVSVGRNKGSELLRRHRPKQIVLLHIGTGIMYKSRIAWFDVLLIAASLSPQNV